MIPPETVRFLDRIVERNARLIVRLTQAQKEAHAGLHDSQVLWHKCHEPSCRLTRQVIEKNNLEDSL